MIDRDEMADNELKILTKLSNDNLVKYYDHFELVVNSSAGNRKIKLAIITEFCEVPLLYSFI